MALNFVHKIIETANASLEKLSVESTIQPDLETAPITFDDLFKDHLLFTSRNCNKETMPEDDFFDLDTEGVDMDGILHLDIPESFHENPFKLPVLDKSTSDIVKDREKLSPDVVIVAVQNDLSGIHKKKCSIMKKQSNRIELQTNKKITDQIQRENARLALEAQSLDNTDYVMIKDTNVFFINGQAASPATQRYMSLPTDLDAMEEEEEIRKRDESERNAENKIRQCFACQKPQENESLIRCVKCLQWFHVDCIGVDREETSETDTFTCKSCQSLLHQKPRKVKTAEETKESDIVDDNIIVNLADDDDCLITMAEQPVKFSANIFQLIKPIEQSEIDINLIETPTDPNVVLLSPTNHTGPCLNQDCTNLVDLDQSLYCSKKCIDAYTKVIVKNNHKEKEKEYGLPKGQKLAKMTRFVLAQPTTEIIFDEVTAPTEDNLNEFLVKNPTFKVYQNTIPEKTNPDPEKIKKSLDLMNTDPTRHIKMVKQFATIFKRSMSLKMFNAEFNNIWQYCIRLEVALFDFCDKRRDEKYMGKVKELSDMLRMEVADSRLCRFILFNQLSVSELLVMTKDQAEEWMKNIALSGKSGARSTWQKNDVGDKTPTVEMKDVADKKDAAVEKKDVNSKKGLSILSDTTHLHGQHLYDINCQVCNGTAKTKEKKSTPPVLSNTEKSDHVPNKENGLITINPPNSLEDVDNGFGPFKNCEVVPEKLANRMLATDYNNHHHHHKERSLVPARINHRNAPPQPIWQGLITYKEVGDVMCKSHLITRYLFDQCKIVDQSPLPSNDDLLHDQTNINTSIDHTVEINGRSNLSVIVKFLEKLRRRGDKELLVLRLHPADMDGSKSMYMSMFEYFHTRERCGAVNNKRQGVKDCFIYPLSAFVDIPTIFLPLIGLGLEKERPHLLLMIIVRTPIQRLSHNTSSPKLHDAISTDQFYQSYQDSLRLSHSPIITSNDLLSWVISARPDITVDDDNPNKHVEDCAWYSCDSSPLTDTLKSNSAERVDSQKITELSGKSSLCERNSNSNAIDKQSNADTTIDIDRKINTAEFLRQFAEIVNNGPAHVGVDSLKNEFFDSSIFRRMTDIVVKAQQKDGHRVVTADKSIEPEPFQYKSKQHLSPIPVALSCSGVSVHRDLLPPHSPETISKSLSLFSPFYCDSRNIVIPNLLPSKDSNNEGLVLTSSGNFYLKRKHSTRRYTYYDSFDDDEDSAEKRLRYFFNPYCEWVDPDGESICLGGYYRSESVNDGQEQNEESLLPDFKDVTIRI